MFFLRRLVAAGATLLLFAASCIPSGTAHPIPSSSTRYLDAPSWSPETVPDASGDRSFGLYVPSDVTPGTPLPLVLSFHDEFSSAEEHAADTGFDALAAAEGFVVAHPSATDGAWNLGDRIRGDPRAATDIGLVSEMIDVISEAVPIDQQRIYATGLGVGGMFATLLACRMPDRVSAVAAVGLPLHHDGFACPDPHPTRLLAIVGRMDWPLVSDRPSVQYELLYDTPGGLDFEVDAWTDTNGCDPTPKVDTSAPDVTRSVYGCSDDAALEVYIHPGGYFWPKEDVWGIDATATIWSFFDRFREGPIEEEHPFGAMLARDLLADVDIEPERPAGFDSSLFSHWSDLDRDGCDTDSEVLIRDAFPGVEVQPVGCAVVGGEWYSSYDGVWVADPGLMVVDHLVPLEEAWESGARDWDAARREAFANDLDDPRTLISVSVGSSRSRDGADPSKWMPPNRDEWCRYLAAWVTVKAQWGLSVDAGEHERIRDLLDRDCEGTVVDDGIPVRPPSGSTSTTTAAGDDATS